MSIAQRCACLPVAVRRAIALGIVPLCLLCLSGALCAPLIHVISAQKAWRIQARDLVARAKGAQELRAQLSQQISTLRSSWLWSKLYEPAGSGVTAGLLYSDVSVLLSQTQSQAQSVTPIPVQEAPFFNKFGVRLTASMRVDQLQRFMSAVEAHPRYLRIERLAIVAPQTQADNENPPLAVTADIYGFEKRAVATVMPASGVR